MILKMKNLLELIDYNKRKSQKNLKKAIKDKDYSKLEELIPTLNTILEETRVAKKKGQRMENRLKSYYDAALRLGFYRKGRY